MAVTSIHAIKRTIQKAVDYICQAQKVGEKCLITEYGCNKEIAGDQFIDERKKWNTTKRKGANYARHIIQSFNPEDNVSPEEAHKIAQEFCERYLDGKYQFVTSTHVDTGIIHNHIIFNNVSFETGKCYNVTKDVDLIQEISDQIQKEHGLSIIPSKEEKENNKLIGETLKNSRSYYEDMCLKKGISYKEKLQSAIDLCINQSNNYKEFLDFMKELKFEIRDGNRKYLAFKFQENKNFINCKEHVLGADYTREKIKERIEKRNFQKEKIKKEISVKLTDKKTLNAKEKIESDINNILNYAMNYEEFQKLMSDMGYEFDEKSKTFYYKELDRVIKFPNFKLSKKCRVENIKMFFAEKNFKSKNEYVDFKERNNLKFAIDKNIRYSDSLEEFFEKMDKAGYEFKIENNILKFKNKKDKGFISCTRNNVGTNYTYEKIKDRVEDSKKLNYKDIKKVVDANKKDSIAYKSWATSNNISAIMENLMQARKYNIRSFSEVSDKINEFNLEIKDNLKEIENKKEEIKNLNLQISLAKKSGDIEKFEELSYKKQELNIQITDLYDKNRDLKYDVTLLKKIQKNAEIFMNKDYSKENLEI